MKNGTKNPILMILLAFLLTFISVGGAPVRAASQSDLSTDSPKIGLFAPVAVTPGPKVFNLCASDGSLTMPDGAIIPVWGFVETTSCAPGLVATLPGPELRAVAGDSVTINLTNALSVSTSILIPGQTLFYSGGVAGDFTAEALPGGSVTYTFIAKTGTYLYESGTAIDRQIPMGLYGALVVESGIAGEAYGPDSAFDAEAVLVLSEFDPALNNNPYGFNMLDYKPRYWLMGGKAYPDTSTIPVIPDSRLLLRYLNAGFHNLSMSLLGSHQRIVAKDSYLVPTSFSAVAETIPAGQTMDAIVAIPATQAVGSRLAVFNRNMYVTNGSGYPGGMLTFIEIVTPYYGVSLSPASNAGSGVLGNTVSYILDVTNTGNSTDNFTVAVSGNLWATTAPASVGPLIAGSTAQITVDVQVPAGAVAGDSDLATVTVTSVGDGAQFASSSLTTTASAAPVYGVSISPVADGQSTFPADIASYTLDVTNTGNSMDSFTVVVSGNLWTTTAPASVGPLAAGSTAQITVDVQVPTGAVAGNNDLATVTVTSVGDGAQFASSSLTTTALAAPVYGVLISPAADGQSILEGNTASYTLDVTNTGDTTDTFTISVSGNVWITAAPAVVGPLIAGSTAQIIVDVDVPLGVSNGDTDTAMVTAASQGNNTQLASSNLTTTAIVPPRMYFSTPGALAVPGVAGPNDDADIYTWDGASYARIFDGSVAGLPANADIDGLHIVDLDTFYLSFERDGGVNVPTLGVVMDEDIVLYNAGTWSLYFDGSAVGLADGSEDVDAFDILPDDSIVISTFGVVNPVPDLPGTHQDEDLLRCVPTTGSPIVGCTWSFYFDGSDVNLATAASEDIDALAIEGSDIYISTLGNFAVTGLSGEGRDVFICNAATIDAASACSSFSMYFDGSLNGLTDLVDALDLH